MIGKDILYLGEVPTDDLIVLYNMADVLVHLSLYEGFGLTVLEAMQCGTPVVVSNASSLPEVAGKAGFAVPPHDVKIIADAVYNILVNYELRTGMIETGLEHVKQFSWERAARDTLKLYRGE
jgi:glycosyltransferase involved in cell wall biosynthesis